MRIGVIIASLTYIVLVPFPIPASVSMCQNLYRTPVKFIVRFKMHILVIDVAMEKISKVLIHNQIG